MIPLEAFPILAKAKPETRRKVIERLKRGEVEPTAKEIDMEIKRQEFDIEKMVRLARSDTERRRP